MENYIGNVCPFCNTEIKESDVVKICPDCGVAHHEACWTENNGCSTIGCSEQHSEADNINSADVCTSCGTTLEEGQAFCPKCGTPKTVVKSNICNKCGAELQEGQDFCPKCGQKVGLEVDVVVQKKSKKKIIIPIVIIAVVAIVAVVLFLLFKTPSVEEIVLSSSSVELNVDEATEITYNINPDKARDVEVSWKSSDRSVASVNNYGTITAKGEGTCTITATAGDKSDSLTVTVKDMPDFASVYDEYCDSSWAELASDGSYLSIDTNPDDEDDYVNFSAYYALSSVNEALGLPDSLFEKMNTTRSIDGRQTETYDNITVSWIYHPDNGLEAIYEAR